MSAENLDISLLDRVSVVGSSGSGNSTVARLLSARTRTCRLLVAATAPDVPQRLIEQLTEGGA